MTINSNYLISIYIISFFKYKETMKCLQSLQDHLQCNYEVILIDNASASPDELRSFKTMMEQWPQLRVVQLKKQKHCPWIRSKVLEHTKGKYIFFLDNDCFIENDIFPLLLEELEKDQTMAGISPGLLYHPKRTYQCLGVEMEIFEDNLFRPKHLCHEEPYHQYNTREPFYSDLIPGGCSLFRRKFLEHCRYDKKLKNIFGDFDLCMQGKSQGWRYKFHPGCYVLHDKTSHSKRYLSAKSRLTDWSGGVALFEEKWGLRYFILKHIKEGRVVLGNGQHPMWLPRKEWPENMAREKKTV